MNIIRFVLLAAAATIISACSSSPGNVDLEAQIKPKLVSQFYDVVSIKKTSGKDAEKSGAKVYSVQYEYVVKFKRNLADIKKELQEKRAKERANFKIDWKIDYSGESLKKSIEDTNKFTKEVEQVVELGSLETKFGSFKAGETQTMTGDSSFSKVDNGWRLIESSL